MVARTPAALNAAVRSGRSAVSQRTEDFVSGSSTATLSAELLLPLLLLLPPPPPLSLPPQAATPNERAHSALAMASQRRGVGERITCSSSLDWTCVKPEASAGRRPRGLRGPGSRAPRRARRERPP